MPHVARLFGGLVATAVIACAVVSVRASDYAERAPDPPQGEPVAPEVNPRYFNRGESEARPLETSEPRPLPIRPIPQRQQGGERTASGTDDAAPAVPDERPAAVAAARPLTLAPPSTEKPAGFRAGELPPVVTGAASLGIVLGLFLLVVWVVRRGMPKNATLLPREAVEVLGRAALVGRQQVHLVRCGNKLLLLSVSPSNVETLTEITDPEEVDRLAGLCQGTHPRGGASFRQILGQFSGQPRERQYFHREETDELDFAQMELGHHRAQELRS